jgi:hypothetical protein
MPAPPSPSSIVRVFYVSTGGVEQKAYDLEPGVRYAERTACPGDVWRARTLAGLLVAEQVHPALVRGARDCAHISAVNQHPRPVKPSWLGPKF